MRSITMQMMKKNLRMLIPAGIAILIGTAFIAATLLFTNAFDASLREQTTGQFGGANYSIMTNAGENGDAEPTVGRLNLSAVAGVDGVEGVRPDVARSVMLTSGSQHGSGVALATSADAALLPVEITEGEAPSPGGSSQIAIPGKLAGQWGLKVGDSIELRAQYAEHPQDVRATITGLTDDPHNVYGYYNGASVVSDDIMVACSDVDSFDAIGATAAYLYIDPAHEATAVPAVKAALASGMSLQDRAQMEERAIQTLSSNGGDVTKQFLLAFGVLALVVAALVIANTFQVLVAQRRRTLALLRTIGATKRQLYVSVLEEAGILGLVSSALGVAVGTGLMALASLATKDRSLGSMRLTLVMSWQVIALPILFGVVMTVLASVSAARTATGVTPLEAMRPLEISDQRRARVGRAVFGCVFLLAGVALALAAIPMNTSANGDISNVALLAGVGGCMLTFVGLAMTALFWLPWLMKGVGALVSLCGPSVKLADANIQKNPRRIAATGTALLIGVTLISTLATGAAAAKATMNQALDSRYSVDVTAYGPDIPAKAVAEVKAERGVAATLSAKTAQAEFEDAQGRIVTTTVIGVPDVAALQRVLNIDLGDPEPAFGPDDALMPTIDGESGETLKLKDGSASLTEIGDDGEPSGAAHRLHVTQRAFKRIAQSTPDAAFVDASLFDDGTFKATGAALLVKLDVPSDLSLSNVYDAIEKDLQAYPDIAVGGPVAERSMWESMVNMMLMLLVALLAVAVVIAVIGVANTLSLSVIERTRESATLRAIGMTRGQLKRSLAVEALLISLVTSVVGMVVGTLFGWLGIYIVMSSIADVVYVVDWATYGIILAIAVVCSLLASVFPARRAVRTPPVEALAES
ncbi:ABC transporter permease [Bifidobacterium castoris]|uniref:Peptide ABC transporter permease n=1 Tax=Bifidobacterium castoris TaxID=2306972 RepID=A0A430F9R2_9BIFI|nr:ABC transporter permease [Bifidobacterium castoris]RSX49574.1 peptide ABC transporter permease [Bifidobacterium castoris]